jgi:hypothetical protein
MSGDALRPKVRLLLEICDELEQIPFDFTHSPRAESNWLLHER